MKVADQFGRNLAYCRRRAKLSQESWRFAHRSTARRWVSWSAANGSPVWTQ